MTLVQQYMELSKQVLTMGLKIEDLYSQDGNPLDDLTLGNLLRERDKLFDQMDLIWDRLNLKECEQVRYLVPQLKKEIDNGS